MAHGHQHGFRWQCRLLRSVWPLMATQTSTWPPVVAQTTDINTDPGCSRVPDPGVAFGAAKTQMSPLSQMAMQAISIHMGPGSSTAYGYWRGFRLLHRLWTSAWPSVVTCATGTISAPSRLRPGKAKGSAAGLCAAHPRTLIAYTTQDHLPRNGIALSGQDPLTSTAIKKMHHRFAYR